MSLFEQILAGVAALIVVLWFWPGVRAAVERSRHAPSRDWMGAVLPLAAVIAFVVVLILLSRG